MIEEVECDECKKMVDVMKTSIICESCIEQIKLQEHVRKIIDEWWNNQVMNLKSVNQEAVDNLKSRIKEVG